MLQCHGAEMRMMRVLMENNCSFNQKINDDHTVRAYAQWYSSLNPKQSLENKQVLEAFEGGAAIFLKYCKGAQDGELRFLSNFLESFCKDSHAYKDLSEIGQRYVDAFYEFEVEKYPCMGRIMSCLECN